MEKAREMAFFVIECGLSPKDYWNLSVYERDALVTHIRKKHKK